MKNSPDVSPDPSDQTVVDGLPPGILALELTFRCTACRGRIRIDGRAQGCYVHCPRCRAKTTVPTWSARKELPPTEPADGPLLTPDEVAFLTSAFVEKPDR